MNSTLSRSAIVIAALCFALPSPALADIARPESTNRAGETRSKENTLRVVIEAGDGPEAQVWLPPSMVASNDGGAAGATAAGLPPLQTAATGLALSLSLVLGGLWLVRTRRRLGTRATASAAAVFAALAGTAVYAFANAAPPRHYHAVDPGTLRLAAPNGEPLAGTARYYYGYDEGVIRIVLPKPQK